MQISISLYSTALGYLACHKEFNIRFENELAFIEERSDVNSFFEKVAALLVACEMARFGSRKNEYARKHFQYYVDNFELFFNRAKDRLDRTIPEMEIQGYNCCDWRLHIEKAKADGAGILAFPPFFKGDYESQFKFIEQNIHWPDPDYDIYEPKMLSGIIDDIDSSDVPYCVLSDQLFDHRKPVLEYVTGRKVPHYCYANTDKSSVRHLYKEPEPFAYRPIDLTKLHKKSKVQIVRAESKHMDFIKDIYLQKTIIHSTGVANFLVFIDKMLVGGIIYSLPKFPTFGHSTIYLLSDVTICRAGKLSKFIAYLATSKTLLNIVSKKLISNIDFVVTTARTKKHVSMKYRGIYKVQNKREADNPEDGMLGDFAKHAEIYGKHARGVFFRRTYKQLEEVIARAHELYPKLGAVWIKGDQIWIFPNGATLKMRHLWDEADAENYQGHSYSWICIEEVTNWPTPAAINKIRATLRSAHGVPVKLRLTGNPGGPGHNWVKQRYIILAPTGYKPLIDPESGEKRVYIPSRLEDNPALTLNDPFYERRLLQSGSPALVKAWRWGMWDIVAGGFFDDVWNPDNHVLTPFEIPATWKFKRSFDWGSGKPSSLGLWAISDGTVVESLERAFP